MKKRLDTRIQERHDVRPSLFASRKRAPEPFQPTVAPIAPCPLRHLPVDHHLADRLFAETIRRRRLFVDETKILRLPVPQPLDKVDRVFVVRNRTPRNCISEIRQDHVPMSLHLPLPSRIRKLASAMDRREHFSNPLEKPVSVTSDRLVPAFRKKLHFANQVGPAELKFRRSQTSELLVRQVRASLEIHDQRNEFRSEKTGFSDFRREFGGVVTSAMFAPIPASTIFRNDERLLDEWALLGLHVFVSFSFPEYRSNVWVV